MYDMPEHLAIDVDENGDGPAFGDDVAETVCWCGTTGCRKYEESNG